MSSLPLPPPAVPPPLSAVYSFLFFYLFFNNNLYSFQLISLALKSEYFSY